MRLLPPLPGRCQCASRVAHSPGIPPPIQGWPIGGVTSSANVEIVSFGGLGHAECANGAIAAAASNSRRVTADMELTFELVVGWPSQRGVGDRLFQTGSSE